MNDLTVRPLTLYGVGNIEFAELVSGDIFYFNDDLNSYYFVIGDNAEVKEGGITTRRTECIKINKVGDKYFVKDKYLNQILELNKFYFIKCYTTNEDENELTVQIFFERKTDS